MKLFNGKIPKVLFLSLVIFVLIACGSGDKETSSGSSGDGGIAGGELKVAYPAQPPMLDPYLSTGVATADIMWHVYETLIVVDSDFNVQPMLAESYDQSDDGKTITFNLREGVLFHNGDEMKAEDVVASMEQWQDQAFGASMFSEATFEAEDDYTVVMELDKPMSTALTSMSYIKSGQFPAIMPKEVIDEASDTGVTEYIGTGPFEFVEWEQDQQIHLKKYEEYQMVDKEASGLSGKREALIDDLYFIFTPDSSTQVAGLQSGEYDVAHEVHRDSALQLESDPAIDIHTYPDAYLPVTFNKKSGLFTDKKARQAVAAGLDYEAILTGALADEQFYQLNNNLVMYHQTELWNSDVGEDRYNEHDIDKAKKLLDEAGYDGEEVTIVTDREYEEHYDSGVIVKEQLEQLGMNVNLEVSDWATLLDRVEDENAYDMYIYGMVPTGDPTTINFLVESYAGWTESDELEELLDEIVAQPTLEDATEVYDELMEWHYDYMPAVKIGDYDAIVATRDSVHGYSEQNEINRPVYWNITNE